MKKYLVACLLIGTFFVSACCNNEEKLNFSLDSYSLTSSDISDLDSVVARLKNTPSEKVKIYGYTDITGTRAYNIELSKLRAQSAANYLMERGIKADRITVRAWGDLDPIASNMTMKGRAENRRVEIFFYQ